MDLKLKEYLSLLVGENNADFVIEAAKRGIEIRICGVEIPTGKTTLCQMLCDNGYNAQEVWRELSDEYGNEILGFNQNSVCVYVDLNRRFSVNKQQEDTE